MEDVMRVSSYRSNNRFTIKFSFNQREVQEVFKSIDIVGNHVTLYGSWHEGLVFRRKDEDPNIGTESEGPAFTAQTKGSRTMVYLQVAASRIEGAPQTPFSPFTSEPTRGGEHNELLIFPMTAANVSESEHEQADVSARPVESTSEIPVVRAMTILKLFLEENPDVFIRTQDGKTYKTFELVRQEFVKL
jgi:hypothetical protein